MYNYIALWFSMSMEVSTYMLASTLIAGGMNWKEAISTILLGNLGSIGHPLAEMRNQSGTGQGRSTDHVGLEKKHAKLAVGAAATLAVVLYECHEAEPVA